VSDIRVITPEEIEVTARAIVSAKTTSLGIEVTTPVVYPNGDLVTVAVTIEGGEYVVHDAGFGAMYLNSAGVRLTRQLARRFTELAARYGCEFIGGRMTRRCSPEHVAMAAVMVANASRTIGDQALEIRRQAESDFRTAVADRIRDIAGSKRVRENEQVQGESGRKYRIPSLILDNSQSYALAFVVPLLIAPLYRIGSLISTTYVRLISGPGVSLCMTGAAISGHKICGLCKWKA